VQMQHGPNLKPGLSEITTTMDVPRMPMAMPPATRTQCYTSADLEDGRNIAPTSHSATTRDAR